MRFSPFAMLSAAVDIMWWAFVIAMVLTLFACATIDKGLLKPEIDPETKQAVYVDVETGDKQLESAVKQMATEEAAKYEPSYIGPKTKGDWADAGFDGNIAGVSIGGALAAIAAGWWMIRRRRLMKSQKKAQA